MTSFKYLGLIIETKLNWKDHVNHAAMKASKILNLKEEPHHSSKTAKTKAYTGLVRPHLEYMQLQFGLHTKRATSVS